MIQDASYESRVASQHQPVYVRGTGMTKFGELWHESADSLSKQAVSEALEEAKLKLEAVDLLVVGNMLLSQLEKRAHVGRVVGDALGYAGPSMAVEAACASGGIAVRQGVMAIRAGMAKKVLVVGVEKMTDADGAVISRALMGAGSEEEQWAGATFPSLYALMHQAYQQTYHVSEEEMAFMAVWSHKLATLNPLAQFQKEISTDMVVKSPLIADPVRQLHCAPISDGAAALVLVSGESRSVNSKQSLIQIVGSGQGGDSLSLAKRKSLTTMEATKQALVEAQAQIFNFQFSIFNTEVVEVHDCFSVAGLIALEDLGFCGVGNAAKWLSTKTIPLINPSGGLKACGHPVGATGVKQVVAVVRELKKGKTWGLSQNIGGTGATAVVHLLRRINAD